MKTKLKRCEGIGGAEGGEMAMDIISGVMESEEAALGRPCKYCITPPCQAVL